MASFQYMNVNMNQIVLFQFGSQWQEEELFVNSKKFKVMRLSVYSIYLKKLQAVLSSKTYCQANIQNLKIFAHLVMNYS